MASVFPGKTGLNYIYIINIFLHSFSLVAQSCPILCDPMDCSTPGLPVHHQLSEFTQTHVHWVGDTIQPSHPLLPYPPPAFNLYQHQGLFKWIISSHQVAKVLKFQLQHQFFQLIFRADLVARNRIQLWVIPAKENSFQGAVWLREPEAWRSRIRKGRDQRHPWVFLYQQSCHMDDSAPVILLV